MLYRVEGVREADKGKNKGKKTGHNEKTPGGGMTEICGFMRSSFRNIWFSNVKLSADKKEFED